MRDYTEIDSLIRKHNAPNEGATGRLKEFQNMFQIFLMNLAVSSAFKMDPFIVGGLEASIQNWPFITFIAAASRSSTQACGGSLISSQTVLTAAHCLDDTTMKKTLSGVKFTIYMGHSSFTQAQMVRKAIDYETPLEYDPEDVDAKYDIGIMFLSKPVQFSARVQKVILQRNFNVKKDNNLVVAGWGETDPFGRNGISKRLKVVKMVSKTFNRCKNWNGVICAVASKNVKKEYPFSGDSGGPIVKSDNHRQVAIVSFRDESSGISAFTSVPHYYDWIKKRQLKLFRKYCPKGK